MDGAGLKQLMTDVLKVEDLLGFATSYGVVEREGQLDVVGFLLSLVLNGGTHDGGRQVDVLRTYLEQGYQRVNRSSFYERFTDSVRRLLEELLRRAIRAGQQQAPLLPGILSGVKDWLVFDSTTVRLPRASKELYRGTGDYAALKVHKVYSIGTNNLVSYTLSPAAEHDARHFDLTDDLRGYGILFDLAYVSLARLEACNTRHIKYVCRLKNDWKPTVTRLVRGTCIEPLGGEEDFDLLLEDDVLVLDGKAIDAEVVLGRGAVRVPARLVGVPTPKGYCFFLTNLARVTHGPLQIGDLYRCRWEIEVDNAVDKEGARLDEIGASKDASIRILLLASMISATLSRTIVQSEKLAIRKGKKPGQPADRPPLHAIQLMKALAVWYRRFADMLLDPSTSPSEWNRTMGRLRSLAEDPNWRRKPSVLDVIQDLTAPPLPRRVKGVSLAKAKD
jgi:putative transposase